MSTRKTYDGEWVGGTPKCGEYRDMPPVRYGADTRNAVQQ